jgi:hypothetical protein
MGAGSSVDRWGLAAEGAVAWRVRQITEMA